MLPARYSDKNGFDNVSIYCKDIVKLLVHIQNKIIDSMFMLTGKDTILTRLNYKDIIDVISKSMVKKDIVLQSFKKIKMKENTKSCRTFVIKIAECCNIACKYCYMFKSGDSSFLDKPKFMSPYIARKAIQRAKEHCEHHDIPVFNLILHGGEPLLAGIDFVDEFVQMAKEIFKDSKTKVVVGVQTNGTLIDDKWCEIFKQDKINVGISLDGIKKYNDAFRVDRKGHGTFERIVKGIRICKRNGVEPGILSVINPNCDPLKLYELYKSLNVKGADVLLLEAN